MVDLRSPRFEGTARLKDGRQLGYAEYGPVTGRPLLWFHGSPGARRQVAPEARKAADERDVRIIAIERPGIGDSTSHAYEAIVHWAHDIEEFCDAKGIEEFGVAGLSGGGPYALACAHEMPDRVVAVAVLGGVAPAVGPEAAEGGVSTLIRMFSPVLKLMRAPLNVFMRRLIQILEPFGDRAVDLAASMMPPGDQRIFADPAMRHMFKEDLLLGSREQMQAIFHDAHLFGRDWGFLLKDLRVPVYMWYGDADNIVPIEHGEHMAERIPNAVFRTRPDEGHLGGLGASQEIIDAILSHWPEKGASPKRKQTMNAATATRKRSARKPRVAGS
jgi:pimeloyl-ACP methyl ester carboxylesterase